MNAELCKRANEKVGNPNVLINIISRRVRQLNSGGGGLSRPLIADVGNLGLADIALRELLEDKIGWDLPELVEVVRHTKKKNNSLKLQRSRQYWRSMRSASTSTSVICCFSSES